MSTARDILLRHLSEQNFERWVVREANRQGVCGFHVRLSEASVQGVHTRRFHDHSDAHGWPDWVFWGPRGVLFRELKGMEGRVTPDQKRCLGDLVATGADVGIWRPVDEELIRETFRKVA